MEQFYFLKLTLPLNIFEERYIDMIDYSLSKDRLIGNDSTKTK